MPPAGPFETKADFLYATHIKIGRDEHKKTVFGPLRTGGGFFTLPGKSRRAWYIKKKKP